MQVIEITHTRNLVIALLKDPFFGNMELFSASVDTAFHTEFSGRVEEVFFEKSEDLATGEREDGFVLWERVRPVFFQLLRGDRLPLKFQLSLLVPSDRTGSYGGASEEDNSVQFSLGIRYSRGQAGEQTILVTSASVKDFSANLAKNRSELLSLEETWTTGVKKQLLEKNIL